MREGLALQDDQVEEERRGTSVAWTAALAGAAMREVAIGGGVEQEESRLLDLPDALLTEVAGKGALCVWLLLAIVLCAVPTTITECYTACLLASFRLSTQQTEC